MEIIKIHYKISKPVRRYKEIKQDAEELKKLIVSGNFKGNYQQTYAIAHCQVSERPMSFFVIDPKHLKSKENPQGMFESQVIINPKILEAPYYKAKAGRLFTGHTPYDGQEVGRIPNTLECQEACMSFPYRREKALARFDQVKVSYQIKKWWGLKTVKRDLSGFTSEIFQHEYDHTRGKNIFFESEEPREWWVMTISEKQRAHNILFNQALDKISNSLNAPFINNPLDK